MRSTPKSNLISLTFFQTVNTFPSILLTPAVEFKALFLLYQAAWRASTGNLYARTISCSDSVYQDLSGSLISLVIHPLRRKIKLCVSQRVFGSIMYLDCSSNYFVYVRLLKMLTEYLDNVIKIMCGTTHSGRTTPYP